jgi:hypothetical protein
MKYSVTTLRAAGLEARWTHNRNGAPIIVARDPQGRSDHQRVSWWHVGKTMWQAMKTEGIKAAFDRHTLLGDVFSVPA